MGQIGDCHGWNLLPPAVRLLALRTAFVATTTLAPAVVAGLMLPGPAHLAAVWLLPALSLTVGTVALSTRLAPHVAVLVLVAAWLAVSLRGLLPSRDPLLAVGSPVLLACALVLAAAVAVLGLRRRDITELLWRNS